MRSPSRSSKRIAIGAAMALAVAAGAVTTSATAAGHVETVVSFDPGAGELTEGVAVDKRGNVFVSLSPLGQVVKVPAGSATPEPFGQVELQPGDLGVLGLATDAPGNVYGAVFSSDPDTNGVWKFDARTGDRTRIAGTDQVAMPNSIAFDSRGTMYVTDTILGAVWRVPKGGSAEPWIVDSALAGTGAIGFPFPLGANGIAIRHGVAYVGVTEQGSIVAIPILPDGSAGEPSTWFQDPAAVVDGLALDVHGNAYFANPVPGRVVRVGVDGSVDELATNADGLDGPTSVAFGTGRGERQSLYVVSFSVALGTPLGAGPSLAKLDTGQPGLPVP